ncbi:MAG: sugar transferase [Planctomycetota bacterium]
MSIDLEVWRNRRGGEGYLVRQAPLHRALQRERARVDRMGGSISLLVFVFTGVVPPRLGRRRRLQRVLEERVRLSDEVGVVDGRRVFVLMPDTTPQGAKVLAGDVLERMSGSGVADRQAAGLDYAVYRYSSARGSVVPRRGGLGDDERMLRDEAADEVVDVDFSEYLDDVPDDEGVSEERSSASRRGDDGDDDDRRGPGGGGRNGHRVTDEPKRAAASAGEGVGVGGGAGGDAMPIADLALRLPWWKRATDIAVATCALVVLSPVLAAAALAIKLDTRGPVLFVQKRMGNGRRVFPMFKFRTMVQDAEGMRSELLADNEQDGPAFKLTDDPRVTRVGRVLRATSVDELPQLVNVLLGHMTLVGPRPLPLVEAEAVDDWHDRRHSVHPGLTCIWQVKGRSGVLFEDWARMDLSYIGRRSFWRDMKIMLLTVPAVLKREGAK